MSKVDISFVKDIIDGYIIDLESDLKNYSHPEDEFRYAYTRGGIKTLESLRNTLKHFIKDANTLGKKK